VLFFMRSTVYARNFESTLRLLAERGHDIHVAAPPDPHQTDQTDLIGRLCRECPRITHGAPPAAVTTTWAHTGYELRRGIDSLRYLAPEYGLAPKLRSRAEQKSPAFLRAPLARRLAAHAATRRVLVSLMRLADRAIPTDSQAEAFVRLHEPDLVVVTPLIEPGSPQSTYVRAAHAIGIPTALCVYSWDNLTNKGLIHDRLDTITVWNEAMKAEAMSLHRVPDERVVVTGSAPHDHWFEWRPRDTREAFCARVGLDPVRPYLLYVCSSKFIAPDERAFVVKWIGAIRAASPALRQVGVLIRPHPQHIGPWRVADVAGLNNVAVWPREAGNPVDVESRAVYFDSMHHSSAVVGVNTSALIESAIVGRGVYTWLAPEFRDTQEGTLHFRHLRGQDHGLLCLTASFDEHVSQLERAMQSPQDASVRSRRFVEAFVRPYGFDEPATPRVVAALESTAAAGVGQPDGGPWWAPLVRPAILRLASSLPHGDRA